MQPGNLAVTGLLPLQALLETSASFSTASRFHAAIWVGWTSYLVASSATVWWPWIAYVI